MSGKVEDARLSFKKRWKKCIEMPQAMLRMCTTSARRTVVTQAGIQES